MQATQPELDTIVADRPTTISLPQAQQEDAYWRRAFWQERYYSSEFDYEDYAPAYAVGYIGCAQYGGEFADAKRCLCANWERIKGDSRLSLKDALPAMRAAWDRIAALHRRHHPATAPERAPVAVAVSTARPRMTAAMACAE